MRDLKKVLDKDIAVRYNDSGLREVTMMMLIGDREAVVAGGDGRGYMYYNKDGNPYAVHVYRNDGTDDWMTYPAMEPMEARQSVSEMFHIGGHGEIAFACVDELTAVLTASAAPGSSCYGVPHGGQWQEAWTEQLIRDGVATALCVVPLQCPEDNKMFARIDLTGLPDSMEAKLQEIRGRTRDAIKNVGRGKNEQTM